MSLADHDPADTDPDAAREELSRLVERIADLQARLYAEEERSLLVVLQGIDAAGKDSTVAHVFRGTNPQGVRVYTFKEPSNEEAGHDFLWRYHQHTPAYGMIHVFNRSHYEDVLVVRVKGSTASGSGSSGRTSTTSSPPTTCASGATGTPTRRPTTTPCG